MNRFIKETLNSIEAPVEYLHYSGSSPEYVIFSFWGTPLAHADDKEIETKYTVQLDVFSKGNFVALAKSAKDKMISAGFMKIHEDGEFIKETETYRKILRFSYASASE